MGSSPRICRLQFPKYSGDLVVTPGLRLCPPSAQGSSEGPEGPNKVDDVAQALGSLRIIWAQSGSVPEPPGWGPRPLLAGPMVDHETEKGGKEARKERRESGRRQRRERETERQERGRDRDGSK